LDAVLGSQLLPVTILPIAPTPYSVSWNELVALASVVRLARPTSVFEIGTFDGRTTANLAANCESGSVVYSLDIASGWIDFEGEAAPYGGVEVGHHAKGYEQEGRVRLLTGDSATFDFSAYEESIDLVFVDGDHSFEAVERDTEVARRLVRPGGYVLWHDYLFTDGVTRALRQAAASMRIKQITGTTLAVWQRSSLLPE
jgi:predicted O-methyltransferase YrrM